MTTLLLGEGVGLGPQANLQILVIGKRGSKPEYPGHANRNASSIWLEAWKLGYPSRSMIADRQK